MIKEIIVMPRERIKLAIKKLNKKQRQNVCVISISSPFDNQLNFGDLLKDYLFADEKVKEFNFDNQVVHFEFDDVITNPNGYFMPIHFRQAVAIWQFAKLWHYEYHQDEEHTLYIHCDAGKSRSAAIAQSINKYWNIPVIHLRTPDPNIIVAREMDVAFRYLEEGLSPAQQREADEVMYQEVFTEEQKGPHNFPD